MSTKPKKRKRIARTATPDAKKRALTRFRKKEPAQVNLFSELIDKVPVGILIFRLEARDDPRSLRLVAINATASRISRLPQEIVGTLLKDFSPGIFSTDLPSRYVAVVQSGVPQDIDDLRYGNERMPDANYRVHVFPLGHDCVGVSFEDITARRQAEETVRQMVEVLAPAIGENYFRALVSHVTQACQADLALVGRVNPLNDKQIQTIAVWHRDELQVNFTYDIAGTPSERVLAGAFYYVESGLRRQFPNDAWLAKMGFDACMGIPLQSNQGSEIGIILLLNRQAFAQPDQAKTILRVVAARASAELDRQQSEEALRSSEEFLQMSQRAGNVGSWRWDLRTNAVQWSDSMFALYGMARQDFDGTLAGATRTTHPDDMLGMTNAITTIITQGIGGNFEYRVIRADGETAYLWAQSNVVCDRNGVQTHVIGTVIDLTGRKKFDAQIQQAQKLESLGVLAGGIAHDFNNILTSLLGYADLAMQELPAESTARPLMSEAVKAARRASELTKQMLAYSGRGQFVIDAVDLNEVIEDMGSLLQVSISKKCVLNYRFMPKLPAVEADTAQLRQIIMNLIINAAEAIGDRNGIIELATGTRYCDAQFLATGYSGDILAPGDYVYVEVSDTGSGMSSETRARMFDPFFTTKFTGRGLGLAAVHGIVRGHRGMVTVESELGKGTVFKIFLPASKAKVREQPSHDAEEEPFRGAGTVLVVDDEEAIRDLATQMLERAGFTVMTANDGRQAVELFCKHMNDIRLVLLDMTMPTLDGEETFDALRAVRNDIPAILSSGYDEQSAVRRFAGKGLAGFLQKPYTFDQLVNACRIPMSRKAGPGL